MPEPQAEISIESIREDKPPGSSREQDEVEHYRQLSRERQDGRQAYSERVFSLLKTWSQVVLGITLACGFTLPDHEPTTRSEVALAMWGTAALLPLVHPALRRTMQATVSAHPLVSYFCFTILLMGWMTVLAESRTVLGHDRTWSPVDILLSFQLPSAVLVALVGSITAGAVTLFAVVLKHYFNEPKS